MKILRQWTQSGIYENRKIDYLIFILNLKKKLKSQWNLNFFETFGVNSGKKLVGIRISNMRKIY